MIFGERQIGTSLDQIRRDHVARYEFAAKYFEEHSLLIDLACGIGYGSNIMAKAGHKVIAVDRDEEALEFGRQHWNHQNIRFQLGDANGFEGEAIGDFAGAVCFETVEHIANPLPLLQSLRLSAQTLLVSVPNENVMPWRREDGATTAFHYRHYTPQEFEELLNLAGWEVVEKYGQAGPESELEKDLEGRTLIAVCKPGKVRKPVPRHVAILGFGPSLDKYTDIVKRLGSRFSYCDEVWAINSLGGLFHCDYIFHMDDVRIQEIRARAMPQSNIAAMLSELRVSRVPIVTSRTHPDYPALVAFPLEDVLNSVQYDYFNSTAAYAIAYAIHIGVEKISIFGMDFTYPNAHDAEKGRACVEFWLGMAAERGIKLVIPKDSSLMDAMYSRQERFYGYDTLYVDVDTIGGKHRVRFTEITELPTAEEIEERYCHKKHPNAIVEDTKSCESSSNQQSSQ